MVRAKDGDGGEEAKGVSADTSHAAALFRTNQTVERLTTSKRPIADPVAFLLDRVHTIELWRRTGVQLNLLQLGASLVRGVLRRGQHGPCPLRVFESAGEQAISRPTSPPPTDSVDVSRRSDAHADGSGSRALNREGEEDAHCMETKIAATAMAAREEAAAAAVHHRHAHYHHTDTPSSSPSVARQVLVRAAGHASVELYMGLLISFFSHGVSSVTQPRESISNTSSKASSTTAATSTPSSSPDRKPLSASEGRTHTHAKHALVHVARETRQLLSTEASQALQEVHRAARAVIKIMYDDVKRLNLLVSQTGWAEADAVQPREAEGSEQSNTDAFPPPNTPQAGLPQEEDVHDICTRLTLLTANLYSLLSLLDFFSVEAEWLERDERAHPIPSKASVVGRPSESTAEASSGRGFAAGLSSALALVANAFADHGSQASGLGVGLQHYTDASAANARPLHRGVAERQRGGGRPASSRAATSTSGSHLRARGVYTVERFHALFDVGGHLPRCVWDMFAAATTVLSQCGVLWSLTHGDASCASNFNATAAVVFSETQSNLLRQLHRLCRRFDLLRQRVIALFPVSPVRFKVKQILDWSGFLYADDPTHRSTQRGVADLVDLHEDGAHRVYALRPRWSITAANRAALHLVAAAHFVPLSAPTDKPAAASTFSSSASAAATTAGKVPIESLLATLASVGTTAAHGGRRGRMALSGYGGRIGPTTFRGSSVTKSAFHPAAEGATQATAARSAVKLSVVSGWVGMRNSGNTCFLNSVVQLLSSAALFRDNLMARVQDAVFSPQVTAEATSRTTGVSDGVVQSGDHHGIGTQIIPMTASTKAPDLAALFRQYGCRLAMVLLLGELRWRAQHHYENHPVLPDYLDSQLPVPFNDHRQHDASEFLHALLDQLDEPAQPGGAVVGRWFSGQTATTMQCTRCRHARTHVNAFWDVSTPILAAATGTGETAIADILPAEPSSEVLQVGPTAIDMATAVSEKDVLAPVVKHVEVEHFSGATATTITYVDDGGDASPQTGHVAAAWGEDEAPKVATQGRSRDGTSPSPPPMPVFLNTTPPEEDAPRTTKSPYTLQHLLLHVLHPTLNKELLHGGNALDCAHCGCRTSTALVTQLVADVSHKAGEGMQDDEAATQSAVAHNAVDEQRRPESLSDAAPDRPTHASAEHDNDAAEALRENEEALPRSGTTSSLNPFPAATDTAAGGGLPWYLVVQLNRFAYQRATQSLGKVTDAVPLNEVIIVPAYPLHDNTSQPDHPQEDQRQQHDEEEDEKEVAPAAAAEADMPTPQRGKAVLPTPVWVAYRLQTIIVHSGSTPSSGHYFVLTRDSHAAAARAAESESGAAVSTHVEDVQAYVQTLGAALTSALDVDRVFLHVPCEATGTGEAAAASVFVDGADDDAATKPKDEGERRAAPAHRAGQEASSVHAGVVEDDNEEDGGSPTVPHATVRPRSAPPAMDTPPNTAAACATEDGIAAMDAEEQEDAHSPLLTPAPTLPATTVSVSGAAFFDNWVMLNDSNVQAVSGESMRRILCGTGGGVYSALETPYLVLYEKLPFSYVHGSEHEANEEDGLPAVPARAVATTSAHALQGVWGSKRDDALRPPHSAQVELAAEAVAIFTARLHEEEARAQGASHPSAANALSTGAPLNAAGAKAYDATDNPSQSVARTVPARTSMPTALSLPPRSKPPPLRAPSSSGAAAAASSSTSKRLRAKAAAYAQQAHLSKDRLSRRRLARAEKGVTVEEDGSEEREGEKESKEGREAEDGDGDDSEGAVSLD